MYHVCVFDILYLFSKVNVVLELLFIKNCGKSSWALKHVIHIIIVQKSKRFQTDFIILKTQYF